MGRLPFIDWVRGFAVVAMVLWHTGDAWLSPGLKAGPGFNLLRFVGGLAAPSFLFLAGMGAALAAKAPTEPEKRAKALRTGIGRGLEVLIVGYLLRFQTWMIDAAAITHLGLARSFVPIGVGYAIMYFAAGHFGEQPRKGWLRFALGLLAVIVGMLQVEALAPGRLARLLQVDVLQAIGASLVILAVLEHAFGFLQKPWMALLTGLVVASSTHAIWTHLPGPLPHPIAGYLGRFDPPAGLPLAGTFPLFPWFAYASIGAALGRIMKDQAQDPDAITVVLAVWGAALGILTSEAHPYVHNLFALEPWTTHPVRVLFRVGIVLALFLAGLLITSQNRGRVLLDYGKTSMRIYWAHMLFAYGVLGRFLQKRSSYGTWAGFAILLLAAMWLLARIGSKTKAPRGAPT